MVRQQEVKWELNVSLLDDWLQENGRGSKERLAATIGRTTGFLDEVRRTKRVPSGTSLFALSEAMGVRVEKLVVRVPKKTAA